MAGTCSLTLRALVSLVAAVTPQARDDMSLIQLKAEPAILPREELIEIQKGPPGSARPRADWDLPEEVLFARDLGYLAGDVTHVNEAKPELMQRIGWEKTFEIIIAPEEGGEDNMAVYKKGCLEEKDICDHCAVVFAGTDDERDTVQDMDYEPIKFCSFDGAHRGFVEELEGYIKDDKFAAMMETVTPHKCEKVFSVGHSLGGSVASLFAFCANLESGRNKRLDRLFGASKRKDFRLVTFGAPAVAKTPLYNGKPHQQFYGRRFGIIHKDMPAISPRFGTEALKFVAQMMDDMDYPDLYNAVMEEQVVLKRLYDHDKIEQWRKHMPDAMDRLGDVFSAALVTLISTELRDNIKGDVELYEFIMFHKKDLQFEFDAIPQLNLVFKFVHPLVIWQPLTHPSGQFPTKGAKLDVPAFEFKEAIEPMGAPLRVMFGIIASTIAGKSLPNHMICCYIMAINPQNTDCNQNWIHETKCVSQKTTTWR